jgi:hypothetical protein
MRLAAINVTNGEAKDGQKLEGFLWQRGPDESSQETRRVQVVEGLSQRPK